MSKRPAEIPLDPNVAGSPASKKARVEDGIEAESRNGATDAQRFNGREQEQDDRNGSDILAAADREGPWDRGVIKGECSG